MSINTFSIKSKTFNQVKIRKYNMYEKLTNMENC